jgi:hypothetical protein
MFLTRRARMLLVDDEVAVLQVSTECLLADPDLYPLFLLGAGPVADGNFFASVVLAFMLAFSFSVSS